MSDAELKFSLDEPKRRFVVTDSAGDQLGLISYTVGPDPEKKQIAIDHTETSPQARGQGIADKLTDYAFTQVRDRGWKVWPRCPYTISWVKRHPEVNDLVIQDPR